MGKGISKVEQAKRNALDALVKPYWEKGFTAKEIAFYLNVTIQAAAYSIKRLRDGYSCFQRASNQTTAEREAQMLIDAKLAPVHKPKAHKIMVNGWENGRYVHYTAYDVSEFWGL